MYGMKKVKENSASLADLLAMFEGDISIADIMHQDIWVRFPHLLLSVE